jgi:hypothetical protein
MNGLFAAAHESVVVMVFERRPTKPVAGSPRVRGRRPKTITEADIGQFHSITSSAVASNTGGTEMPNEATPQTDEMYSSCPDRGRLKGLSGSG